MDRMVHAASPLHSPCIGVCAYDDAGMCQGCRRSRAEVDGWKTLDDGVRLAAWSRAGQAVLGGGGVMRLPLTPEEIAEAACAILAEGGAWAAGFGSHWFYVRDFVERDGAGCLMARGEGVQITLDFSGKVRALAWVQEGVKGGVGGVRGVARGNILENATLEKSVETCPLVLVRAAVKPAFPLCDKPTVLEDGRCDLGLGLASVRLISDGDTLTIETPIARVEGNAVTTALAARLDARLDDRLGDGLRDRLGGGLGGGSAATPSPTPNGLTLSDAYALGSILLPKGRVLD